MNRKQRRIQEAKSQKPNGKPQPSGPKAPMDEAAIERFNKLMSGEAEPPNAFVAYLVQKANGSNAELIALQNNIQQGEQQLTAMKAEAQKLQGVIQNYIEDIRAWDKKSVEGEKVPEVPSDNAVSDAKA
jgi:hypothetical protein